MSALTTAFCLGLANFAWQGFGDQNWQIAIERTYFQALACLTVWLVDRFSR